MVLLRFIPELNFDFIVKITAIDEVSDGKVGVVELVVEGIVSLIQRHILKIRRIAVRFLVVELIDSHVGFLDFLGTIAEGIGDVHWDGHDDDHFGCKHRAVHSFDPLGPYFEYFAHNKTIY